MTRVEQLAAFIHRVSFEDLSEQACEQLKIRVLDGLGCAVGALEGEPIHMLKRQIDDFGGKNHCTLIGGGKTAPDRASLYNSALVRYLDFNDSYLAKGETCHPSDNLGAVLAATEYAQGSGRELLTALAIAYQVQCRLSDVAPVRAKGFDHTTQGSYALAAAISKALRLNTIQTANAIAISGTAFNALRVTRTGTLSHWKGLAYPNTAFGCAHAVFMAMRGITGPLEVFEGNKGFMDVIAGEFEIDWSQENLGFDIVEISSGFISIPTDDWLRLVEKVKQAGLKAKPEVGIQFGAGGASSTEELEAEGTRNPEWAIAQAKRFLEAGAHMIMIESEGITENVKT